MFLITKRLIGKGTTKCIGYNIKNLDNGVEGSVPKDLLNALVTCSLVKDVTMDSRGKLLGINGFKVSAIKNKVCCLDEDIDFKDIQYFDNDDNAQSNCSFSGGGDYSDVYIVYNKSKNAETASGDTEKPKAVRSGFCINGKKGEFKEAEKRVEIETGRQIGYNNIEIRDIGYDEKTGYCYVIARTSENLFKKEFESICVKSKVEDGYVVFYTYLKNLEYRICDAVLENHQVIATRRTLVFLKKAMQKAKQRRIKGVDMFNIVNPKTYSDLLGFYYFLCQNAIYVEGEVTWVNSSSKCLVE